MVASIEHLNTFHGLLPQETERRLARQDGDAAGLLARYREAGYLQADINPLHCERDGGEPSPAGFRHVLHGGLDLAGADMHALEVRQRKA